MINKIVYFTLTSATEAPMGIVIRKAGLPPLFFSFPFFCFFFIIIFFAPSCSARSSLMKLWEFRGISPEHKAPWEEQTLARQRRRDLSPRRLLGVCEYSGVPFELSLKKNKKSGAQSLRRCLPHTSSPPHLLFCMLIKMFVLPKKHRVLSNFRGVDKPMT